MLESGDIEHVESIVTKRFPLRNCGSWNRIKKVLLEPAAQSGEAPAQQLSRAQLSHNSRSPACQSPLPAGAQCTTQICPNAIIVPVVVEDRPGENVAFVACRTSGKLPHC